MNTSRKEPVSSADSARSSPGVSARPGDVEANEPQRREFDDAKVATRAYCRRVERRRVNSRSYNIIGAVRFAPRHFLTAALAALLVAIGCAAPGTPLLPIQPTVVPIQTASPVTPLNNPPRVVALTASAERVEIGEEVTLAATVLDDESAVDDLTYRWEAISGSITGTGRTVKWKAPINEPTPATYKISLIVIDKYGLGEQSLEHRVTAESSAIHVNDSPKEARAISELFLRDFADSKTDADTCLRNFSDSCAGKARERRDIVNNRNTRTILSSRVTNQRVTFNSARTRSNFTATCAFTERLTATGVVQTAEGTCDLDLVYEKFRWWLCESSYHGLNEAGLRFIF